MWALMWDSIGSLFLSFYSLVSPFGPILLSLFRLSRECSYSLFPIGPMPVCQCHKSLMGREGCPWNSHVVYIDLTYMFFYSTPGHVLPLDKVQNLRELVGGGIHSAVQNVGEDLLLCSLCLRIKCVVTFHEQKLYWIWINVEVTALRFGFFLQ